MATVHLPLSAFSRKILLAEYGGAEPLEPGRADWLSDMLRIDRRDSGFQQRAVDALRTSLAINLPHALAEKVLEQGERIGVVIHRQHIEMLTRAMLAAATAGGQAKTAMLDFYNTYGIDDDDLEADTLYREYQRFRKKILRNIAAKSAKKTAGVVLRDSRISQATETRRRRWNQEELDAVCALVEPRLCSARIRYRKRITFATHLYIYSALGGRDVPTIARRFRRHIANVYRALANVRARMRRDLKYARAIRPLLDPVGVLPLVDNARHICSDSPQTVPA